MFELKKSSNFTLTLHTYTHPHTRPHTHAYPPPHTYIYTLITLLLLITPHNAALVIPKYPLNRCNCVCMSNKSKQMLGLLPSSFKKSVLNTTNHLKLE